MTFYKDLSDIKRHWFIFAIKTVSSSVVKTTALERTVASLISGQTGGGMNIFFHLLTLTALAVGEPVLR